MSTASLPARVGVLGSGQVGRVLAAGLQSQASTPSSARAGPATRS